MNAVQAWFLVAFVLYPAPASPTSFGFWVQTPAINSRLYAPGTTYEDKASCEAAVAKGEHFEKHVKEFGKLGLLCLPGFVVSR